MIPQTAKKLLKMTNELYKKEAQAFSDTRKEVWEKEIIEFVNKIEPGSSVLDLGCGNGRLFDTILKLKSKNEKPHLKTKNLKYLGIDPSKEFIKINKKKFLFLVDRDPSQCEELRMTTKFKVGDGLTMNFKNEFDYVITIAVLHHIPSEKLQLIFLKNIYNALKPGGKILISTWNRLNDKYLKYANSKHEAPDSKQIQNSNIKNSKPINKLTKQQINDLDLNDHIVPWRQSGSFRFIHTFEPEELKSLAKKAGFKNIKILVSKHGIKTDIKTALNIYLIGEK